MNLSALLGDKSLRGINPCSSDLFCRLAYRSCLAPSAAVEASRFRCSKVSFLILCRRPRLFLDFASYLSNFPCEF